MTDGGAGADAADVVPPCDPGTPFDPPVAVDAVNTPYDEYDFRLTPDELTAYFTSGQPDDAGETLWRVYVTRRTSLADPFKTVEMNDGLTQPNSGAGSPSISGDAHLLLYQSGCWGILTQGKGVLCQSLRADTSTPFSMGTLVNLNGAELAGTSYLLPDGLTLYFTAGGLPGPGIGASRRTNLDPSFSAPTKVSIAGIVEDGQHFSADPVVTPDERLLFFSRPETTVQHIWQAWRASTNDAFGSAAIVAELSSPLGEAPTWVSPDACRLYFMRKVSATNMDIFVASRPLKH